jgi:hypothetical protein
MITPHKCLITTYLLIAPFVEYIVNLQKIKQKNKSNTVRSLDIFTDVDDLPYIWSHCSNSANISCVSDVFPTSMNLEWTGAIFFSRLGTSQLTVCWLGPDVSNIRTSTEQVDVKSLQTPIREAFRWNLSWETDILSEGFRGFSSALPEKRRDSTWIGELVHICFLANSSQFIIILPFNAIWSRCSQRLRIIIIK